MRTTSPTYPSSFTPQCSGIKHPLKSVVLPRQSAAHHQLLVFAPSITQLILKKKKKKNQAPGILRNIQIFTTVFSLITKSVTKAYSTLCTNSRQKQGGAIPWHSDTASMVSSLRSPPAPQLSRAVPPINRLWAGFQQDGASSSCAGTSFCYRGPAGTC